MKNWKHWKWQCIVSAPFLPWLLMQHMDFIYHAGLALGWESITAGLVTMVLTMVMLAVFIGAYIALHEHDD